MKIGALLPLGVVALVAFLGGSSESGPGRYRGQVRIEPPPVAPLALSALALALESLPYPRVYSALPIGEGALEVEFEIARGDKERRFKKGDYFLELPGGSLYFITTPTKIAS